LKSNDLEEWADQQVSFAMILLGPRRPNFDRVIIP
jgi:hypothetical protein